MKLRHKRSYKYNNENILLKDFFSFYLLEPLSVFADHSLNNPKRIEKIQVEFANITDRLYLAVKDALLASIRQEYRHASGHYEYGYDSDGEKIYYGDLYVNIRKANLIDILNCFTDVSWSFDYGGSLWAEATRFAIEEPQTTSEKARWLDKVFDLNHNNGKVLDKTEWEILSQGMKDHGWSCPLDIKYESGLKTIAKLANIKHNKLFITSIPYLPQAIL